MMPSASPCVDRERDVAQRPELARLGAASADGAAAGRARPATREDRAGAVVLAESVALADAVELDDASMPSDDVRELALAAPEVEQADEEAPATATRRQQRAAAPSAPPCRASAARNKPRTPASGLMYSSIRQRCGTSDGRVGDRAGEEQELQPEADEHADVPVLHQGRTEEQTGPATAAPAARGRAAARRRSRRGENPSPAIDATTSASTDPMARSIRPGSNVAAGSTIRGNAPSSAGRRCTAGCCVPATPTLEK